MSDGEGQAQRKLASSETSVILPSMGEDNHMIVL